MDDVIGRIDDALGCQAQGCDKTLDDSPDDDFCSARCQQRWHEARANLPAGYVGADSGTAPQSGRLQRWGEVRAETRWTRGWGAGVVVTAEHLALFTPTETWAQDRRALHRTAERLMRELDGDPRPGGVG